MVPCAIAPIKFDAAETSEPADRADASNAAREREAEEADAGRSYGTTATVLSGLYESVAGTAMMLNDRCQGWMYDCTYDNGRKGLREGCLSSGSMHPDAGLLSPIQTSKNRKDPRSADKKKKLAPTSKIWHGRRTDTFSTLRLDPTESVLFWLCIR